MQAKAQIEIPDQAKLQAALINNVGLMVGRDGGDAVHSGIAMLRRAVAINPLDLNHRANLASFLLEHGKDDESEELATFVLKHDENYATAWQVLGIVNTNRGRMQAAIDCFRRALENDPGQGQRKFDLAAAHLRAGDWQSGWPHYESRGEILPKGFVPPDAPTWSGEKTGRLAIWPDQGFGDLFMFARFVLWAKQRADKVTFLVNPHVLVLFQGYNQIEGVEVVSAYAKDAKFDHQICVASLPLLYGLTPDNVPPDPHLLTPADVAGNLPRDGLRIGIAWQGNPQFPGDRMRSIPFREFLPLAADPRNTIYSLQVGPASADIAKARAQRIVRDMAGELEGEWSHTAALISQLDLVVSSCTAIPHLAGALNVPTFIMIPQFADWRWLHGRDDTPWYPNTRLFRQTKVGEWASVVKRVMAAIDQMHRQHDIVKLLNRQISTARPPVFDPNTMVDPNLPGTADQKEPDVAAALRKILRPGDTFVDVGANVGIHTVLAALLVGQSGRVLAFEPGENALPELREVAAGLPNVEIVAQPLWSEATQVTFHLCADGSGGNATWDPGKFHCNAKTRANPQAMELQATTLDIECGKRGLSPRLIKIDTEGADQRVLEGAVGLLFEQKPPFIITEYHEFGLRELGCSLPSLRALMAKAGYATFQLFTDGLRPERVPDNETLKCPHDFIINLLFSTEDQVNALWPDAPPKYDRVVYGYRLVEKAAAEAAA